jgi:hypothetical protein
MSWETRSGGRRYYFRARKVNGRVVKEYLGTGELAEALAALDALDREGAALRAEAERRERQRHADLDGAVAEFCRAVDAVVADALRLAGYHRHARGQWRRKRGNSTPDEHGRQDLAVGGQDEAGCGGQAAGGEHGAL